MSNEKETKAENLTRLRSELELRVSHFLNIKPNIQRIYLRHSNAQNPDPRLPLSAYIFKPVKKDKDNEFSESKNDLVRADETLGSELISLTDMGIKMGLKLGNPIKIDKPHPAYEKFRQELNERFKVNSFLGDELADYAESFTYYFNRDGGIVIGTSEQKRLFDSGVRYVDSTDQPFSQWREANAAEIQLAIDALDNMEITNTY
jgi:hypothetical protein